MPNLNFVNQSAIVQKQALLSAYEMKVMPFIASGVDMISGKINLEPK
ncbi:hypothetical protein [Nostoc sp.]